MTRRIRSYSELKKFQTLEDRYEYLRLRGVVGQDSWGWDRFYNQKFYHSSEWRSIRNKVIVRDNGCDLGVPGFEIGYRILIHHMNPIWIEDITHNNLDILDPEYLICTSEQTHRAIHYGNKLLLPQTPIDRKPGDTKIW